MNKKDTILVCILLVILIISSVILTLKITNNMYDKEIYEEVYTEYEDIKINTYERKITTENVIAIIKIPKINIEYPVIFETTEEFLKVSPTKYAGGFPNEPGNFYIIGHNYYNGKHFSNLKKLEKRRFSLFIRYIWI